jgi:excisionase family DNA binding protein
MALGLIKQLYTAEDAAERLNLHVKTVRRFIRDGRLPAKRIGKEYRITKAALDEFAGVVPASREDVGRVRQVIVSSIVDVEAISPEDSQRIVTMLMAGMNSRKGEGDFPRIDSLYDVQRGRLRITITASASLTSDLLRVINALAEVSHD